MDFRINTRPVVLTGGRAVSEPPHGYRLEWEGDEPVVTRVPAYLDRLFPKSSWGWPQIGVGEASRVLLKIMSGSPLGYHGKAETKLEGRIARLVRSNTRVFACSTGTNALKIAYLAVLHKRQIDGALHERPAMLTSPLSFQATWVQMLQAGIEPVFLDVSAKTGCPEVEDAERRLAAQPDVAERLVGSAVIGLYDSAPDLRAWRAFSDRHKLALVADLAHAPLLRWQGKHAAALADIVTTSGQGSKVITPGWELGLMMSRDPVLAALCMMIRNCGRVPEPLPAWWPRDVLPADLELGELPNGGGITGDNDRTDEIAAVMYGAQLTRYLDYQQFTRKREIDRFREVFSEHNEISGLFDLSPEQLEAEGMNYKTNLRYKGDLPPEKVRHWIAREGTVEVAKCYALPWTREALFNPDSRPWVWSGLAPEMRPDEFPNATWFAERSMLIPHEYWLRPDAAETLIAVLRKVCRWHDRQELREWAGK